MKTVFIYALKCPTTEEIRYIGKSGNLKGRLKAHRHQSKYETNHRACWFRALSDRGLKPILEIIDEVPEAEWQSWEAAYIEFFKDQGCDLVNGTRGGDGVDLGTKVTDETRAKLSAAKSGKNHYMYGRRHAAETKELMRAAKLGKKYSAEHCKHISLSNIGKKMSQDSIEKRTKTRLAINPKYHSPEGMIKIIAGIKEAARLRNPEVMCP